MIENIYRDNYCPGMDDIFCECPFATAHCEGAWDCAYAATVASDILNYYDDDYDGVIFLD
jgi:hypothetical protein